MSQPSLPIFDLAAAMPLALREANRLVLTAPTGSGKSTCVPGILVDAGVSERVLILQPRRIAARMLARRVASLRFCSLGEEVGFQTRYEKAVSARTRIQFVTEGILLRMLQTSPNLPQFDTVIFDEFHERSVNADLGLALVLRLQAKRPDLKVVIMSATLDNAAITAHLAPSRSLVSDGRLFPVDVSYSSPGPKRDPWELAAEALRNVLKQPGDVLIFMPGAHEIRKTVDACKEIRTGEPLLVLPLHGDLPADQQDAVMDPADRRKVIVATNIAETSLTIPGVRHVIDSGLARVAAYDPAHGINTLPIEPICRDSADQRAGRAGREAPGTCRRLWTEAEHNNRPLHQLAEIHRVDLSPLVLLTADLGIPSPSDLPWLEPPNPDRLNQANLLLHELKLLDDQGRITPLGTTVSGLPVDPRIGRMLAAAADFGCLEDAALIAASLTERPIQAGGKQGAGRFADAFSAEHGGFLSDLFAMIDALHAVKGARFDSNWARDHAVNASAARAVWRAADSLLHSCQGRLSEAAPGTADGLLRAVLLAFPDHLAVRRDRGTLICGLRNDRRAELDPDGCGRALQILCGCGIREVRRAGQPAKLILEQVSEVREEWLDQLFPDAWEFDEEIVWNDRTRGVELRTRTRCLGVTISELSGTDLPPAAAGVRLAEEIRSRDLPLEGFDKTAREWMHRARWVAATFPERKLTAFDDDDVAIAIAELCAGKRRYDDVRKEPVLPYLQNLLSWPDQQFIDQMAPAQLQLPSGRQLRIRYRVDALPRGNARIQELYGLEVTPRVAGGRVPVLLEILGPNMRPVQITDDLANFWETLYPKVKQELSRRYPRHEWR